MVECLLVCVTRVWGASRALAEATINIARRGIVDALRAFDCLDGALRTVLCPESFAWAGIYAFLVPCAASLLVSALELDVCGPALLL